MFFVLRILTKFVDEFTFNIVSISVRFEFEFEKTKIKFSSRILKFMTVTKSKLLIDEVNRTEHN